MGLRPPVSMQDNPCKEQRCQADVHKALRHNLAEPQARHSYELQHAYELKPNTARRSQKKQSLNEQPLSNSSGQSLSERWANLGLRGDLDSNSTKEQTPVSATHCYICQRAGAQKIIHERAHHIATTAIEQAGTTRYKNSSTAHSNWPA